MFGLYGRPERYIWDRTNPKSFFFAYPEGPGRTDLFLDTDEALISDFRSASLPAIRANFVNILKQKLSEPAAEYRDEKSGPSSSPAPRPDGDYRLPPLTFDRPSPNMSSESQPRSLTPITERTDDASRQNSTRTASSAPYERRPSDGASKQGSGSSARNPSGGEEPRLAPITDEGPGQWTDEPSQALPPTNETIGDSVDPSPTPATQPTLESQTGQTVWSQDSADRSEASTPTTTHPHATSRMPNQLPPLVTSSQDARGEREIESLPDLPQGASFVAAPPALAEALPASATTIKRAGTPPKHEASGAQSHTPRKASGLEPTSPTRAAIQDEPAAMYLMNMVDEPHQAPPLSAVTPQHPSMPVNREERVKSPSDGTSGSSSLPSIGRKPSGARAPPPKKQSTGPRSLTSVDESTSAPLSPPPAPPPAASANHAQESSSGPAHDLGEDASAYMAYADTQPSPDKGKGKETLPPPSEEEEKDEIPRSSFALSKSAAERRARAEVAAAEQERAMYVPGGGKRTGPARDDTWSDSDEDEDEEDGSPEVQKRSALPSVPQVSDRDEASIERSSSRARALPSIPRPGTNGPNGSSSEYRDRPSPVDQQPRSRPHSRSPQPHMSDPHSRQSSYYPSHQQQPRQSQYDAQYRQSQAPPPPQQQQHQNRQTVWNASLAADHGMTENKSGKFIELEEPSARLTKAFSPHGLLQAGIQDKEDRSAKRQEELARETGSSLINVPAKPPPPQTGLLGAVAAHERDRKNAGGIGATLTDREREKRQNVGHLLPKPASYNADEWEGGPPARNGQDEPTEHGAYAAVRR